MTSRRISVVTFLCAAFTLSAAVRVTSTTAQQPKPKADEFATLQTQYEETHKAMLQKYCLTCHSAAEKQGELDLEQFKSVADIRANVVPWQRVVE